MHLLPVPAESAHVVPVKEVRFGAERADVRMKPQELQERTRASLLHSDDERVWEAPGRGPVLSWAVSIHAIIRHIVRSRQCLSQHGLIVPSQRWVLRTVHQVRLAASQQNVEDRDADDAEGKHDD